MRLIILLLFITLIWSCSKPEQRLLSENSDLTIGEAKPSTLNKNEADTFQLNLLANSFITGYANQIKADVEINILGVDNKVMNTYDDSALGHDLFFFTTKEAGIYSIVVKPFQESEGDYELYISNVEELAKEPEGRVDQLANAMIPGDGPGASIAVIKDNKMVYSKGFGYANLEYGIKNTGQTIFHIASVSKQFTGFAIAMLADQGKVSMQDDIRKYIPELPDFGTPITLNHLVHHTSGLRDQWNLLAIAGWRLDDVITHEQIMRLLVKQRELNFKPGEEMVYCNTGFTLLAEVVHRVTGQSFPAWMKENVFMPLEMNSTLFYDDHEKIVPNRAYSYYLRDTVLKKSVLSYANVGATSLFTTVEDLGKWAINFDSMKVGNSRIMEKMEDRFILNKGDTMSYGYGQGIGKYKGLKTFSHGGADAGYRTMLLRFPEQHFDVIVFSNLASFSPGGMSYAIADTYLSSLYVEEPKKEEEPPAKKEEEKIDLSKVKLADYQGRFYSDELETFYDLEVVNDTLIAHHQRHDDVKLTAYKPDAFNSNRWWMGRVTFTRGSANKVIGFEVNAGRVRGLKFRKINKF